jgi:chromatin segregation and condensation protein Rec8/ScpA/Scc1 (kleisin family)
MAILEMSKNGELTISQEENFQPILMKRNKLKKQRNKSEAEN